jgi:hypothetical protein
MWEGEKVLIGKENLKQELILIQQRIAAVEGGTPECNHGDLIEKVRSLEQQLEDRTLKQMELAQVLGDPQAWLEIMRQLASKYWEQITQIELLTKGKTRNTEDLKEGEYVKKKI